MKILLESHGILGFIDGSKQCPSRFNTDSDLEGVESDEYQVWKMHDRALMQLLPLFPLLQFLMLLDV